VSLEELFPDGSNRRIVSIDEVSTDELMLGLGSMIETAGRDLLYFKKLYTMADEALKSTDKRIKGYRQSDLRLLDSYFYETHYIDDRTVARINRATGVTKKR